MFIGLNDIAKEGQWVLSGSNSAASYTNWRTWKTGREPNGKRKENCVMMYASNGEWNDISCSRKLPYVCEIGTQFFINDMYILSVIGK